MMIPQRLCCAIASVLALIYAQVTHAHAIPLAQTRSAINPQSSSLYRKETDFHNAVHIPVSRYHALTKRQVTHSQPEVFVYYGQVLSSTGTDLTDICADPDIDKVALAFMTSFADSAGFPVLSIGKNCPTSNAAQIAAGATGLHDCVESGLAEKVAACQAAGKPVLLSLGGGAAMNMVIPNQIAAQRFAQAIWDLFLDSSRVPALRPFGSVILDGIDIDIEHGSGDFLIDLVTTLRAFMVASTTSTGRRYYLTAAPQCSDLITRTSNVPATTIPWMKLAPYLDLIMVQFYNNPTCDFSSTSLFLSSLAAWSEAINAVSTAKSVPLNEGPYSNTSTSVISRPSYNIVTVDGATVRAASSWRRRSASRVVRLSSHEANSLSQPKLLIGVTATSDVGSGYIPPSSLGEVLQQVNTQNLSNVHGVMFWDGVWCMGVSSATASTGNLTFHGIAKAILA